MASSRTILLRSKATSSSSPATPPGKAQHIVVNHRPRNSLLLFSHLMQMTVSEMSIQNTTPSHQQRQHWLSEQALSWSGLPVVTIRPTMFLESLFPLAGASVRERGRIELPFGSGKTSPVAAADVARVIATVLADPGPHMRRIYELTG